MLHPTWLPCPDTTPSASDKARPCVFNKHVQRKNFFSKAPSEMDTLFSLPVWTAYFQDSGTFRETYETQKMFLICQEINLIILSHQNLIANQLSRHDQTSLEVVTEPQCIVPFGASADRRFCNLIQQPFSRPVSPCLSHKISKTMFF